ncbi:MAG: succinate-semialdehyde dehydrogenase (NADP(+)) [Porticoccaceae bacterium]|nr:succinate-semialdehyde dehydrogenase (NADP(+)) [Porticoccaceae bacterium]
MISLREPSLLKDQCFIDGQWCDAHSGKTFSVANPATEEVLAHVADGDAVDADRAIVAASRALPGWRSLTARERARCLHRWFELIMSHQEDLALLMTLEQGKPLSEARGEIAYAASFVQWFAEEAKRVYGDVIPTTGNDRRLLVIKQPVGVVAAITPWNFPSAMLARKLGPALAVGCTVVAKPASETPLSALALMVLAREAGIPAGVVNVVTGTDARGIGEAFTGSPDVAKITFTGSTAVGKQLLRASAETVKKVSMELGGNAPVLVFDDADIERAVAGTIASKYRNAGQTCICANRILVQSGVHDRFVAALNAQVSKLAVGNGLDNRTQIGPLISERAVSKVRKLVDDAVARGASMLTGGSVPGTGGYFYPPTVITDTREEMAIFQEEIFGPVSAVTRFDSEADGLRLANNTRAGLAAYFYTRDIGRIWRVAEGLAYGMVGVNEVAISNEVIPFGGVKESGIGREGSRYGVDDYLDIKHICLGGLS